MPFQFSGGGEDGGLGEDAEGFSVSTAPTLEGLGNEDFLAGVHFFGEAADGFEGVSASEEVTAGGQT